MKDQYFGDARDHVKYHLLQSLTTDLDCVNKLTLLWMLTPDDASKEGSLTYTPNSHTRALDAFLSRHTAGEQREVKSLSKYWEEVGITYRPYGDTAPPYFTQSNRGGYFATVHDDDLQDAGVFLDPDIGLTFTKASDKHVHIDEVRQLWQRMNKGSVLVFIQFQHRTPYFWFS